MDPTSLDNTHRDLIVEEAQRGERRFCRMRWAIVVLCLVVLFFMLSMDRYPAAAQWGLALVLFVAAYNFWLERRLRRGLYSTWFSFFFVSLDLLTLAAYTWISSIYISPLAVTTLNTIPLYCIVLLLIALRQDRRLLLYAVFMTVLSLGGIYWLRYPTLEKDFLGASDPLGTIFKCLNMLVFGLSLLFIPKTIHRLLGRQAKLFEAQRQSEKTYRQTLEDEVADRTRELRLANQELQAALAEVQALSGLLPICTSCKKIRNDLGYWEGVEDYIRTHSQADFTHAICPECMAKMYPEVYERLKDRLPVPAADLILADPLAK